MLYLALPPIQTLSLLGKSKRALWLSALPPSIDVGWKADGWCWKSHHIGHSKTSSVWDSHPRAHDDKASATPARWGLGQEDTRSGSRKTDVIFHPHI